MEARGGGYWAKGYWCAGLGRRGATRVAGHLAGVLGTAGRAVLCTAHSDSIITAESSPFFRNRNNYSNFQQLKLTFACN